RVHRYPPDSCAPSCRVRWRQEMPGLSGEDRETTVAFPAQERNMTPPRPSDVDADAALFLQPVAVGGQRVGALPAIAADEGLAVAQAGIDQLVHLRQQLGGVVAVQDGDIGQLDLRAAALLAGGLGDAVA